VASVTQSRPVHPLGKSSQGGSTACPSQRLWGPPCGVCCAVSDCGRTSGEWTTWHDWNLRRGLHVWARQAWIQWLAERATSTVLLSRLRVLLPHEVEQPQQQRAHSAQASVHLHHLYPVGLVSAVLVVGRTPPLYLASAAHEDCLPPEASTRTQRAIVGSPAPPLPQTRPLGCYHAPGTGVIPRMPSRSQLVAFGRGSGWIVAVIVVAVTRHGCCGFAAATRVHCAHCGSCERSGAWPSTFEGHSLAPVTSRCSMEPRQAWALQHGAHQTCCLSRAE